MKPGLFIILCLLALLPPGIVYGQDETAGDTVPKLYTADLDMDGLPDTVTYHPAGKELIFRLSSKGYLPDSYPFDLNDGPPHDMRSLEVYSGGFGISLLHMRSAFSEEYRYDKKTGKFILEYMHLSHYGFAEMSYSDSDRTFTGNWGNYDMHGNWVELPRAEITLDRPFYWGDTPGMTELAADLFVEYAGVYLPEVTETVRFAGTDTDESGNYEFLEYFTRDGESDIYGTVYCNYSSLETGVAIEVTTGTHFYVEPGDGSWHAARGIIKINPIEPVN